MKCEHIDAALNHYNQQNTSSSNNFEETRPNSAVRTDTPVVDYNNNYQSQEICLPNLATQNKQYDLKISVGNVSKYLKSTSIPSFSLNDNDSNIEPSQYNQDLITHKWMIYIRSANCKKLEGYIKKVIFYLHSSYKPYDIVEVK